MFALSALTSLIWLVYLADLGPNETRVLLAAVAAAASSINTMILFRDRRERRRYQSQIKAAVQGRGLVAMVPEQLVKDIAKPPPAAPQVPPPAA